MSGHSKWATIKHKKAVTDKKRGVLFSKLSKLITVTAKENPSPEINPRLRTVIDKARSMGLPNGNIERALQRVSDKNQAELVSLVFEVIGPHNVVFIVNAITDNRNRTLSELKTIIQKYDGKLAQEGSVSWNFELRGVFRVKSAFTLNEHIELQLIDQGAEDIVIDETATTIYTAPDNMSGVKNILSGLMPKPDYDVDIELAPKETVVVSNESVLKKIEALYDALEEHDDVESIYTNL